MRLSALVFNRELAPQQSSRIVRHLPQPLLDCIALFALRIAFSGCTRLALAAIAWLRLPALQGLLQRALRRGIRTRLALSLCRLVGRREIALILLRWLPVLALLLLALL